MGSPVVAILALVSAYTFIYAGIKNVSLISVIKGTPTAASSSASPDLSNVSSFGNSATQGITNASAPGSQNVVTNTQPVGTPRKAQ